VTIVRPVTAVRRAGFTLIEAMVSLVIIAMSASVLLLAAQTTVQSGTDAMEQTIAMGLAQQLIDEVLGQPYHSPENSPRAYPLGPNGYESGGNGRERFNETGDYNGYVAEGAVDMWGVPLGEGDGSGGRRHPNLRADSFFDKFRQVIEVYYVDDGDPSSRLAPGQTSVHRAVEVRIERINFARSTTELVRLRQVFAYVPPPA